MKDWYLIESPDYTGQTEVDAEPDLFADALNSDAAKTVILYSSDLSESRRIRCILLGNTPDTQVMSVHRTGLFSTGSVKAGMYLFFDGCFWLIYGLPGNQGVYEKAAMILCQYPLRWQNLQGGTVERWCGCACANKYNSGESGNSTVRLASDTLFLFLPNDAETAELTGKRVFIDSRGTNPEKVYRITRMDDVLYDYGVHGSVIRLTAERTERNGTSDRQDLRICDYTGEIPKESEMPTAVISGNPVLKVGCARRYTVRFAETEELKYRSLPVTWKIICDFSERIKQTAKGSTLRLQIEDETCIGRSFTLQALKDGAVAAETVVSVAGGF